MDVIGLEPIYPWAPVLQTGVTTCVTSHPVYILNSTVLFSVCQHLKFGAHSQSRTDTPVREQDFKSRASTNSAIRAHLYQILGGAARLRTEIIFFKREVLCQLSYLPTHETNLENRTGINPV